MTGWLPPGLFELGERLGAQIDDRLRLARKACNEPGRAVVGDTTRWVEMPLLLPAMQLPAGQNLGGQMPADQIPADQNLGDQLPGSRPDASPALRGAEPVVWGQGALCVDLGPDDGDTWQRFADTYASESDVEKVARIAQEWRLAVTPYRNLAGGRTADSIPVGGRTAGSTPAGRAYATGSGVPATNLPADISGARVVDLTSMWAGPLCTQLLARAGAQVIKVTCAKRPDGLLDTPLYDPLNSCKNTVDLDLDLPADRCEFDRLLTDADLLVTSLSMRALANFDLTPRGLASIAPRLRTLAITAFPADTPETDWIAYGTGVHAAVGLGRLTDRALAPAYSYPDPLAGLLACAIAIDQLVSASCSVSASHIASTSHIASASHPASASHIASLHRRVSLAEAIQPLVLDAIAPQSPHIRATADA